MTNQAGGLTREDIEFARNYFNNYTGCRSDDDLVNGVCDLALSAFDRPPGAAGEMVKRLREAPGGMMAALRTARREGEEAMRDKAADVYKDGSMAHNGGNEGWDYFRDAEAAIRAIPVDDERETEKAPPLGSGRAIDR